MHLNRYLRGNKINHIIYFVLSILALLNLRIIKNTPLGVTLFVVFYILFSFAVLTYCYFRLRLPDEFFSKAYYGAYFLIGLGYALQYRDWNILFVILFLEVMVSFIYIDAKIYLIQLLELFCGMIIVLILSVCHVLGLSFDYAHFISFAGLVLSHFLARFLAKSFYQNIRCMQEQERSLDDMLKVVEVKCQEAKQAAKSKSNFLSNMSHEIRTPINSILGMNELILRENTDPSIKEYSENIDSSGHMLLSLINDILDFSKIESGKMELVYTEYQMSSTINDLVNMMRPRIQEKGLKFFLEVDERIPSVLRGDDVRIRQVLANILSNAVKYTKEGSITLRVTGRKVADKEFIHFEVEDTGIGISEEDMPKLFEAFRRINEQKNRNIEGTGLGMSITSELLEMMGSRLGVKSKEGVGSNFFFTIRQDIIDVTPIGNFEQQLRAIPSQKHSKAILYAPKARVLVVDDNEMNRKVFRQLLKRTGIQVSDVDSGALCLRLIEKEAFDVIFMDHMMPEMDGVETFHNIRSTENLCKDKPVVILTANAVSGAKEGYLKEGFDAFLSKPVMPDRLEGCLKKLLPDELLEDMPEGMDASNGKISDYKKFAAPAVDVSEMPAVDGLDWNFAQIHFPDKEMLDDTLKNFYQMMKQEGKQLQSYYDNLEEGDNLSSYRIKVHSMKSSAALIGIIPLSGMAKILENAAASEDVGTIYAIHDTFMREWMGYKDKMKSLYPDQEEEGASEFDRASAIDLLNALKDAAEFLDVDTMDNVIAEIAKIKFPWEATDELDELQAAVTSLDTDSLGNLVQSFLEKIG